MGPLNGDETDHALGPKGDLYAVVSTKNKSVKKSTKEASPAYGGVDNDTFIRDSDGAYDPVDVQAIKNATPKVSPSTEKKVNNLTDIAVDGFVVYDFSLGTPAAYGSFAESDSFSVISRV